MVLQQPCDFLLCPTRGGKTNGGRRNRSAGRSESVFQWPIYGPHRGFWRTAIRSCPSESVSLPVLQSRGNDRELDGRATLPWPLKFGCADCGEARRLSRHGLLDQKDKEWRHDPTGLRFYHGTRSEERSDLTDLPACGSDRRSIWRPEQEIRKFSANAQSQLQVGQILALRSSAGFEDVAFAQTRETG